MVTKAPIALAVDGVVAAMVPALRAASFRKKTRGWWKETADTFSAVQIQTDWGNHGVVGKFTVEIGFSYLSLGEPHPQQRTAWCCQHRFRLSQIVFAGASTSVVMRGLAGPPSWWRFEHADDADEVAAVTADYLQTWETYGLPFLLRGEDPRTVRDQLAQAGFGARLVEAAKLSLAFGDEDEAGRLITQFLESLFRVKTLARDESDYVRFIASAVPILQHLRLQLSAEIATSCQWAYDVAADRLASRPDERNGPDPHLVSAVGEFLRETQL
jgi:hypothetical protein